MTAARLPASRRAGTSRIISVRTLRKRSGQLAAVENEAEDEVFGILGPWQ